MNVCKNIIETSTYKHAPFKLRTLNEKISIAEKHINNISQLVGNYKFQLHNANTAANAPRA